VGSRNVCAKYRASRRTSVIRSAAILASPRQIDLFEVRNPLTAVYYYRGFQTVIPSTRSKSSSLVTR
jgi:hypothetical protein